MCTSEYQRDLSNVFSCFRLTSSWNMSMNRVICTHTANPRVSCGLLTCTPRACGFVVGKGDSRTGREELGVVMCV